MPYLIPPKLLNFKTVERSVEWFSSFAGFFCLFVFIFETGVSLCIPGWPQIRDPLALASQMLGLQIHTTMLPELSVLPCTESQRILSLEQTLISTCVTSSFQT